MTYETGGLLSRSEAQKAFSDAISLVKKILAEGGKTAGQACDIAISKPHDRVSHLN
jgi:hypothetical protein